MIATDYLMSIGNTLLCVEANPVDLDEAMKHCVRRLMLMRESGGEVHLIGNGGSASVVEHAQNDFVKAAQTRARLHRDFALQSAYANDLDYSLAFAKSLEILMQPGDLLIAVSSSGESANIINAVCAARRKQSLVITLSGFEPTNRLRQMGDLNFYVPSMDYGHVELTHAALLHHITDEVARA